MPGNHTSEPYDISRILVVGDGESELEEYQEVLEGMFSQFETDLVTGYDELNEVMESRDYDIVLADNCKKDNLGYRAVDSSVFEHETPAFMITENGEDPTIGPVIDYGLIGKEESPENGLSFDGGEEQEDTFENALLKIVDEDMLENYYTLFIDFLDNYEIVDDYEEHEQEMRKLLFQNIDGGREYLEERNEG